MPMTPASTTDGRKTADTRVSTFMTSLASLAARAHVQVERPEQQAAQVLDRVDGAIESVGQARPGATELVVEGHLGTRARAANTARCGASARRMPEMRRRSATISLQDVVTAPFAQGPLVEPVDLALGVPRRSRDSRSAPRRRWPRRSPAASSAPRWVSPSVPASKRSSAADWPSWTVSTQLLPPTTSMV